MVFRNSNNTSSISHFQTKDLGKLKYFLGIEVAQSNSGVVISKRKYNLDILVDTGMLNCKPVDTPMDPNVKTCTRLGGASTRSKEISTTCSKTELSHYHSARHFFSYESS